MWPFGSILKEFRETRGLSMSRLARLSSLTPGYVSRLESGQRHPSYDAVLRLAKALGLEGEERRRLFASAGYLPPDAVLQSRICRDCNVLASRGGDRVTVSPETREAA